MASSPALASDSVASSTPASAKILCWNRGLENVKETNTIWENYWQSLNPKPEVVFLQEVNTQFKLCTKDAHEYKTFYSPEAYNKEGKRVPTLNALIVKKQHQLLNLDCSKFIMGTILPFITEDCVASTTGNNLKKFLEDRADSGTNFCETLPMLKRLFHHFPENGNINIAFDTLANTILEWKTQKPPRSLKDFLIDKLKIEEIQYFGNLLRSNTIFMLPLLIYKNKIIVVSLHAEKKKDATLRTQEIQRIFELLDKIGALTNDCSAIVVGGDFNTDITEMISLHQRYDFEVPRYNPTIHRAIHAQSFMCIDFFAYKNYNQNEDHLDHVKIEDVTAEMIIDCPDLIINSKVGQYNIDMKKYKFMEEGKTNFEKVRLASNHDPLKGSISFTSDPTVCTPTGENPQLTPCSSKSKTNPPNMKSLENKLPQLSLDDSDDEEDDV